jgi:hypothetical protein
MMQAEPASQTSRFFNQNEMMEDVQHMGPFSNTPSLQTFTLFLMGNFFNILTGRGDLCTWDLVTGI